MQTYEKLQNYFLSKRNRELLNDVEYLLVEHKYDEGQTELKEKAEKAKTTVFNHALVGALGGISLSLSLRRYLPTVFGEFSSNRAAVDCLLVFGLSFFGLKLGLQNISPDLRNLKYKLTMCHDPRYMQYLRLKAKEFNYKTEFSLLRDVLNNREYLQWREGHFDNLVEQQL